MADCGDESTRGQNRVVDSSCLSQLNQLSAKFNDSSKELQELVQKLALDNQTLEDELGNVKVESPHESIEKMTRENEELKKKLRKKDEEIKKLKGALEKSGTGEQKMQVKAKDKEIKQLKDEIEKLKQDLAEKTSESNLGAAGGRPLPLGLSLLPQIFPGMDKEDTLNTFLTKKLIPNEKFNKQMTSIIDQLCRSIQSGPFKAKRVYKAGSLAKGTHIRNRSDIDLIVFFNNYSTVQELQKDKDWLLDSLKKYITENLPADLIFKDKTDFSLQFYIKLPDSECQYEVDLLPALDITQDENRTLSEIYKEMKALPPNIQASYSSCLSPLQVDFVKSTKKVPTPGKAKDLMRLLKNWAKEEDVPLSSYFFELLVIYLWRKNDKPSNINTEEYLREILLQLADLKQMAIAFDDNYTFTNYKDHKPPYLLDPVNPFQNLVPLSKQNREHVERKASVLLQRGWGKH